MKDGKPLPNYIAFNENERRFTITSSSKMYPSSLIIRVHGVTNEKFVYTFFDWTLNIKAQWMGEGRLVSSDYESYI